jgi:hypothetical protein
VPIDAGKADNTAPPATKDKAAVIITDWKGEAAEKISAIDASGVELNLEFRAWKLSFPRHAAEVDPHLDPEDSLLGSHLPLAAKGGRFPFSEFIAFEEGGPTRLLDREARATQQGHDDGNDEYSRHHASSREEV